MSIEEATRIIKECKEKGFKYTFYTVGEYHTALDMAIKALEQEPCPDAISRQAVEKITWEEPSYSDALNVLTEVRDKVRALPSVNPQPKTGHWIIKTKDDENCKYYWYECSECHERPLKDFGQDSLSEYCPNCGCRMVEPQERSGEE